MMIKTSDAYGFMTLKATDHSVLQDLICFHLLSKNLFTHHTTNFNDIKSLDDDIETYVLENSYPCGLDWEITLDFTAQGKQSFSDNIKYLFNVFDIEVLQQSTDVTKAIRLAKELQNEDFSISYEVVDHVGNIIETYNLESVWNRYQRRFETSGKKDYKRLDANKSNLIAYGYLR